MSSDHKLRLSECAYHPLTCAHLRVIPCDWCIDHEDDLQPRSITLTEFIQQRFKDHPEEKDMLDCYREGVKDGQELERNRIVAYLRELADNYEPGYGSTAESLLRAAAENIALGVHASDSL